ncbi:MAG: N-acetylmuramoyl-L-alanine amidase [Bacteroidota bacterium]
MLIQRKYILLFVLFVWGNTFIGAGQSVKKISLNRFFHEQEKSSQAIVPISLDEHITSLALRINPHDTFRGSKIITSTDTFDLTLNEHADSSWKYLTSNLVVFDEPLTDFKLLRGEGIHHPEDVTVFLIYAPPVEHKKPSPKKKAFSEGCSAPEMIDQETWRVGLPEPDYPRILNEVHNIIVHHSAGSNTNTNYTDVVRNIYLYHTGVNGWSDIGYNYVVAQDGSIFKGRDPGPLAQDSVMGAHFCGSNSGTLGICVLGNYVETEVPNDALLSLTGLITWKTFRDTMNPAGMYPHPLNSTLNVIAGHRDGCNTLCPGDILYQDLEEIRLDVLTAMEACGYVPSFIDPVRTRPEIIVYPNPAQAQLWVISKGDELMRLSALTHVSGRNVPVKIVSSGPGRLVLDFPDLPAGQYFLTLEIDSKKLTHSIIIQE